MFIYQFKNKSVKEIIIQFIDNPCQEGQRNYQTDGINMTKEFIKWPKIHRYQNIDVIITEKLDGTNAVIYNGADGEFLAGSRTRWLTEKEDNHGFYKWAHEHKEELVKLGVGYHWGEFIGKGIQRNYGLSTQKLYLFNVKENFVPSENVKPLPILTTGELSNLVYLINQAHAHLDLCGSFVNNFDRPEGFVIQINGMRIKYIIDK
jgi:hypothetical protein